MKLKEAQLLGIVALIAVAIILLCMWGGGHSSDDTAVVEEQGQEAIAEPGTADLAEELAREDGGLSVAQQPSPAGETTLTVGGTAFPPVVATEEAKLKEAIDEHAPVDINLTPKPEMIAPTQPALEPAPAAKVHVVQSGDSLEKLSVKYYGTRTKWQLIQDANKAVDPRRLRVGTKLTIPAQPSADVGKVAAAGGATPSLSLDTPAPKAQRTYTVQRGDSLFRIAQKCYNDGGRWKDIQAANPDKARDARALRAGVVLVIP